MRLLLLARRALSAAANAMMTLLFPAVIVVLLTLAGLICGVIGVQMLLGQAWAFIASCLALLILAVVVARGMISA